MNPIKKKEGGIIIKKIFFLITFFSIFLFLTMTNVKASDANFYEAEYIDGIYINKHQSSTNTIYFQKARFFREKGTDKFAYCVEPFSGFREDGEYFSSIKVDNLTEEQMDKIAKIAYFGYGYQNHTDIKWYAITQFLIWKTADPTGGYFYFTDSLNGNKIDIFVDEMLEIDYLVNHFEETPTLNLEYTFVENQPITITDTNNLLSYYQTNNEEITIQGNQITIPAKKKGEYSYEFYSKRDIYQEPIIFYQSPNSQNLVKIGNIDNKKTELKIKVIKTSLEITKIDKDTQSIIPTGEGILDGAKYILYNDKMEKIQEYEIKNNGIIVKDLEIGTYYLKESSPGKGYLINDKVYEITISKEKPIVQCIVENKIIEKKIIINKLFGENELFKGEENVSFEIRNNKNELIKTIITDESGKIEVILPYGTYTFTQINTKDGYEKIDSFEVEVKDTNEEIIELKDYKIPVPDTHIEKSLWERLFDTLVYFLSVLF